ncbi:hypothetical protein [Shewanella litorisediminis]|uniref:Uncharacterized protein n=1 Tax=Shewanella litorisediminis TaxID=1173586 RepID=A0ABX7G508_9GAMM|nr:hypothetical protein [Shewanella litorisediminis]MCL2917929.1 hypothetical protein [Shewanella litorisediminis]QRH02364.1 hypothetical protein JQC75_02760 [Shewanella litorisediminis]
MYQVLRRFSALAGVILPIQLVFAADNSIRLVQTDLELELSCIKSTQALSVALTLPKVFALSQDKSSLIIQDKKHVVAKLYGESSIRKFTSETNVDWIQSITNQEHAELTLEAISFRTGNTAISQLNLDKHKSNLTAFSASCKL